MSTSAPIQAPDKPLTGITVIELASLGPGPHAAMMLADQGATVITVMRRSELDAEGNPLRPQHVWRGRTIIGRDLKDPTDLADVRARIDAADVLLEGYRPGVLERLGLAPAELHASNPGLVIGRITGWGQNGPLAARAGHDLNYVGLTGLIHAIGRRGERPVVPLNLVADFGGGSMLVVQGILAALLGRVRTGRGAVIDAAMVDGASQLGQMIWDFRSAGIWSDNRESNLLDGGAPFYDIYECGDGKFVSVGSIEPQFYALLLEGLGLDAADLGPQLDPRSWPGARAAITARFLTKTRDEWDAVFGETDACVFPILDFAEVPAHPHLVARGSFIRDAAGAHHPAPAPRYSGG